MLDGMHDRLTAIETRLDELNQDMADPQVYTQPQRQKTLGQEIAKLEPIVSMWRQYERVSQEIASNQSLLDDTHSEPELHEMAEEELETLRTELTKAEQALHLLLRPQDPNHLCDAVIEIRAGSGGEEAALFSGDLLRMYTRYIEARGWRFDVLSASNSDTGGFREVVLEAVGSGAYGQLRFEAGVHRVQRVPQTESQGRIHTSAATVAVLPQTEAALQMEFPPQDLRIDVFRASGPGGQSVNTTDSAVRITHIPTGTVAQSQDEKSQHKNKAKALKVLKTRVSETIEQERRDKEKDQRRQMVGTGDRSERIRTYNFPQGRVTDHRINLTLYKLDRIMVGELDELITPLLSQLEEPT